MDTTLETIRAHITAARYALPQAGADDPYLHEAVVELLAATDGLLSAVEQLADHQAAAPR